MREAHRLGFTEPDPREDLSGQDVARKLLILGRQIGLTLDEITDCLRQRDFSAARIVALQLARLRAQMATQQRLIARLEGLQKHFAAAEKVSAEEFLDTIEAMSMFEKYFDKEQLDQLEKRKTLVGDKRIKEVEAEWPKLMAEVRAAMDRGDDPKSPAVQQLAQRWMGLVREFSGGDRAIEKSVGRMYQGEANVHGMETAPMREMMGYISKALNAP
ncbi:MAG: TipAS antibiotic-recognition domain-containing protein [Deltaproteobacteria bacterium]|nr:TipAS antibiotic-recognition domain-containing protein [Deltaproteobacteria bacterium]